MNKVERAEAQAREKEQQDRAKRYSQRITGGCFLKQPKAVTLVEAKNRKRLMKMGDIASAEEDDDPDDVPEGFHLQKRKSTLYKHDEGRQLPGLSEANCA